MKRLFIILSIILLINSYYANSQIEYSVDKWMEYVEELALETEDTERIESLYADLSYLTEHPFDLNAVTEEQLKRLPFSIRSPNRAATFLPETIRKYG